MCLPSNLRRHLHCILYDDDIPFANVTSTHATYRGFKISVTVHAEARMFEFCWSLVGESSAHLLLSYENFAWKGLRRSARAQRERARCGQSQDYIDVKDSESIPCRSPFKVAFDPRFSNTRQSLIHKKWVASYWQTISDHNINPGP